ncbi:RING finger domain protein [Emericellopsis cladophorae]|uniref:RING finger domain protein n=1 Tax=Emericellopsis cladophorae TaxID=2686198 RepID=A0A9Q0BC89_9HYPO|nr:RING finger domain protein [Emericellopsis cladophorae]KAI6779315.1 RING finger domain protein [Emericellopsis cladophorae]
MASSPASLQSLPDNASGSAPSMPTEAPPRCFVCQMDQEPADDPNDWVSPCPCTLEAHHDCIYSWVLDCERNNKPLRCPICQARIELEGPWDPIVSISDKLERAFTRASPVVLFTGLSLGVQVGAQVYGAMAFWAFAGREELTKFLLGPNMILDGRRPQGHYLRRVGNAVVLMNIAPVLLVSQLLPSLANKLFFPLASLYGTWHAAHTKNFFSWPPSPQLAIAMFPQIRGIYYSLWREFVFPYELKLHRQIQGLPPLEERGERNGNNRQRERRQAEGGGVLGFLQQLIDALDPEDGGNGNDANVQAGREGGEAEAEQDGGDVEVAEYVVELDIGFGGEDGNAPTVQVREERADGEQAVEEQGDDQHHNEPVNEAQQERPGNHEAPPAPPARGGIGQLLSLASNAVVSALLLPGVCFVMGEALRAILPRSWTTSFMERTWRGFTVKRTGMLQQQWGRSLVGGCIYVVVKDAVRVYAKSRKVAAMNKRRVKNVDRSRRGSP